MSKKIFTVAQASLYNLVKSVFTNKQDLYNALTSFSNIEIIEFKDVLGYEKKKFNYYNVLQLLKVQEIDDSFRIKITFVDKTTATLEIAIKETNKQIILANGKQ